MSSVDDELNNDEVLSHFNERDQEIFENVTVQQINPDLNVNRVECLLKNDTSATLKARLNAFLFNEDLADVHFLVHDHDSNFKRRVAAHKFMLAAASCVFKAMFYGPLSNKDVDDIEVFDIDYTTLGNILRFIYTDEVNIVPSTLVTTLYGAKKYQITNLERACVNNLSWYLTCDNVFFILTQAELFEEYQLVDRCWDKIEENIHEVINSPNFVKIDQPTLLLLLKRNGLALKEVELYRACLRWAKYHCAILNYPPTAVNIRKVLGEALYSIRFPCMSGDEFAFDVSREGILLDEELVSVFSYFAYSSKKDTNCKNYFIDKPRSLSTKKCKSKNELIVSRFEQSAGGRLCVFDEVHKVDFFVNHEIYVTGFGVYGTRCDEGERVLYIELHDVERNELIAYGHSKISCTGRPKIYQIRFHMPVQICKDKIYTASAEFDGGYPYPTYYGINGKRICMVEVPTEEGKRVKEEQAAETSLGTDSSIVKKSDKQGSESIKTKNIRFVFFKSEKKAFVDTGGEQGQIPQILFYV